MPDSKDMTKTRTIAALLATSALLLTGCGQQYDDPAPAATDGPTATVPATAPTGTYETNPVKWLDKLRDVGCKQADNAEKGQADAWGHRFAQCEFANKKNPEQNMGTVVTLYVLPEGFDTFAGNAGAGLMVVNDENDIIYGEHFWARVDGARTDVSTPINVQKVAKLLGGTVMTDGIESDES